MFCFFQVPSCVNDVYHEGVCTNKYPKITFKKMQRYIEMNAHGQTRIARDWRGGVGSTLLQWILETVKFAPLPQMCNFKSL